VNVTLVAVGVLMVMVSFSPMPTTTMRSPDVAATVTVFGEAVVMNDDAP
jgi:uncharacterized membrane protein YiaA